ncbi:ABC transporter permease [Roseomonas sp. OT10]|uniref:ABC transporter permease n=1 Tax=Roseomonas cutis TaxID=2897332 RepID=UPI001E63EDF7|nr:ABC transporter permease [Roseomonas sp. OT10]UFN48464.1 ABC transporter permease [Roseomonas sp. OT10]
MNVRFLLRRLLAAIPTVVLTWAVVWGVMQLIPGDPVTLMLNGAPASEEVIANERARLGLDKPAWQQFGDFLLHAATGDLGTSYRTRQPVSEMILEQLPASLELAAGGLLVGLGLGVVLGVLAGLRPNGIFDTACMALALMGVSLPSFWIGMVLLHVFGTVLGWVPILGSGLDALILPSITLGLFLAGGLARLIRASVVEVMTQDYIRTGRAKGLPPRVLVPVHVLRNAMIAPLTLLGVQFALLIGGAVVTERVFARPGLGSMLVESVLTKDIPVVQALIAYTTMAYILVNLLVDLLYGLIDPRVRQGSA